MKDNFSYNLYANNILAYLDIISEVCGLHFTYTIIIVIGAIIAANTCSLYVYDKYIYFKHY